MTRAEFLRYRATFAEAARQVLREDGSPILSEAAFPAYSNANPFIRFLFWQRIRVVMRLVGDCERGAALDFGCGGGAMLPFLARRARRVLGLDVDLAPHRLMSRHIPLEQHVSVESVLERPLEQFESGSFDLILALDVLEHVSDLTGTVSHLVRLLRPGGQLIVSGPTENLVYRIGRRFAGPEYSGDYHVRDIHDIRATLENVAEVRTAATLFYPVPLFKIYTVTARTAAA